MPGGDRPPDDIIENDEAIDKWSAKFQREQDRKSKRSVQTTDPSSLLPQYTPKGTQ